MKNITLAIILILFAFPLISSVGVANSYWDDKPLKLAPGEETTISLRLQNEEAKSITMEVSLNSPIASLKGGDTYNVPPGKESVPVYLDVEIPKDVRVGTGYTIFASFKQVSSGEGEGFFQVAQGVTSKVPVEVVGEQESELYEPPVAGQGLSAGTIGIIVLVIAILITIIVFRKRKH